MESIHIPGYEMVRPLGSGGMSNVYLARQRSLDRYVAIKVMKRVGEAGSSDAQQFERRFLLEGRTMAALPHRNIVAVFDIVNTDDIAYIVMEYLDGGTLSEHMNAGVSLGEVLSIIVQTADALEYAHGRGIVHRDLKASNIMFRDRVPVLTDFGIARQQDSASTALTQAGMMVGTPQYMSPEQINGAVVDGRADQYSLGVLFYELLSGTQPFTGETALAVLMAHLTKEPPPLPVEFAAFQSVVSRMLAKDREQRYANLRDFVADLKSCLTQSNTLLMRLRLDPDQSASEQLRELGFASTPSGGYDRSKLKTPSGRAARIDAAKNSANRSAPSFNRPPWPWLVAAAGAVMLVVALWLAFGHKNRLTQDDAQELVSYRLGLAEQAVKSGHLIEPAEASAYEYLQKVLQQDGDNRRANQLLDEIAQTLDEQAQARLAAGKFDEALELSQQSILVRPDDPAARAIKEQIAAAQKASQRQRQVIDLLQAAESARLRGTIFGDKSAYALLSQARKLDPANADVQQHMQGLIDAEFAAVQKSLDAGELQAASLSLGKLEPYLQAEPAFAQMNTKLAAALKRQQSDSAIAALLLRANGQLRAGRLVAPGGDNASESLGEMRKLAPEDARTLQFAQALGQTLFAEAKRQDASGQAARALDDVELALQADPQAAQARDLKQQIEQRLGQRAADLASALSAVQQALNEQRFVAPARADAYTALQALLKVDPDNTKARELLADLPTRIAASAAASAANDAAGANELIAAALKVYPQDAALNQLQTRVGTQLAQEAAAKDAQQRRSRIASLLSAPASDIGQLETAAKELDALIAGKDTSQETFALRTRLIAAIGARIRATDDLADFDATAAILDARNKTLAPDPAYPALIAARPDLRAKAAAAEQARIEAGRGELVLNAFPWARVESVLDGNRKPVSLPQDLVTPLHLTLPAGSYIITFRHPQAGKAAQVIAKVEARKQVVANAAFPTLSTSGYFSRAGW